HHSDGRFPEVWGIIAASNFSAKRSMDIKAYMQTVGRAARQPSRAMARVETAVKNQALLATAAALDTRRAELLAANAEDMQRGADNGLDSAMLDRLAVTGKSIDAMIEGLHQVAALPDPVGAITDLVYRPSGIQVGRMRVPLGVV